MADLWTKPVDISGQMRGPDAIAKMALTAAALIGAITLAIVLVLRFAHGEHDRDLRVWQTQLGLVAETRSAAVNQWLDDQFGELGKLADNASLQLYMTELMRSENRDRRVTRELAESGYLENLLTMVADGAGYSGAMTGPDVRANVRRVGLSGIALVDMKANPVTASAGAPPIEGALRNFLLAAPRGERGLFDLHRNAAGKPSMGFATPIFAVHGDRAAAQQIGWVLGVREVAADLFAQLRQPGTVWKSAEALLVRKSGATIEYLSPMLDGGQPLSRTLAADTPNLAASFAVSNIGGFGIHRDYRNREVLVTSRPLAGAPWTLVYKIDRAESLGVTDDRVTSQIIQFVLMILIVTAAFIAVWRHGASRRAVRAAARFQELARRFEAQEQFLRLVTDSQPNAMFIVDTDNQYHFANRAAANSARIDDTDMIGKTMASVLGPAESRRYEMTNHDVLQSGLAQSDIHRSGSNGDLRVLHAEHVPIHDAGDLETGVMVVEQDITAAVKERERRERTLNRLVQTLLTVVDRRDPYSANHSTQVATVARAIAGEMGLDAETTETAGVAGNMMNVGKILVPSDVLTKAEALGEAELQQIRTSIQASAELLQGVEFDGPVVETLRQLQENWDGSGGPRGLAGEEILLPARIVSVANAFIAMISPRAWRAGASFDEAIDNLMADVGRLYDRRAVTALVNQLDNRDARKEWNDFGGAPAPSGQIK
jgi:PAS domain S-box-containing protein